ncbi:phosphate ABC transporter permease [Elizabethkingia anophelis]|uniref:phosphate ABC transporter permease n=1 Tax=Elizabethkingia anophelis TaxID=1117645 RepID=UPI0021A7BF0D|nr:phosphate ABC transporter permease [Elizabethkingia anophelis]MCT3828352.1 phosphate ABC transporter permease [Elizabethkingia anophelis]MCT3839267.1 phosphate ABC transporter permease [Elizabethkingia anophelis]MCT3842936.1 phosphate ABC transporter permease [Elizabethkingia anophelis]MCT3850064.1 phosphate ABC transporter permease [Elizabethkingia anophelis]
MKKLFFAFIITGVFSCIYAQKNTKTDIWSGSYGLYAIKDNLMKASDTLIIERVADAKADEVAGRYQSDLARWAVTSTKGGKKDQAIIRRFLFAPEDKEDQYKEFGWTELYRNGKMNCIDGNHFFICQTEPKTKVLFNGKEEFYTRTGIFGIWLHYGIVDLKKLK